jgi:hypothetical protein
VEHCIGGYLLLDGGRVGAGVDAVLQAQGGQLLVVLEAVLDGLRQIGKEIFGELDDL